MRLVAVVVAVLLTCTALGFSLRCVTIRPGSCGRNAAQISTFSTSDGSPDADTERKQLELSAAVSASVAGFLVGGTYLSLLSAAVIHHVAKKSGPFADLLRLGLGAPPVLVVKLATAVNDKYDWSGRMTDAVSARVGRWEAENEGVHQLVDGWNASMQYVRDTNAKYDVVGKAASALGFVADVTDSALDSVEKVLTSIKAV